MATPLFRYISRPVSNGIINRSIASLSPCSEHLHLLDNISERPLKDFEINKFPLSHVLVRFVFELQRITEILALTLAFCSQVWIIYVLTEGNKINRGGCEYLFPQGTDLPRNYRKPLH